MSTTYILEPADEPLDDLDSFMEELDRDLKKSAAQAKAARKASGVRLVDVPPPVIQQWFPQCVVMMKTTQRCTGCESCYPSIDGIFLQDIHRNGATKRVRHIGGTIPEDYLYLDYFIEETEVDIAVCPECFFAPEPPIIEGPGEVIRVVGEEE